MGFLDKFKGLFGGGESEPGQAQDEGIYVYVGLDRTGEVVQLRLSPQHELVPDYDEGGYFTRKTIVGPRKFERAEATFHFDSSRRLTNADVSGGTLVDEAAWQAWREQQRAEGGAQASGDEEEPGTQSSRSL